MAGPPLLSAARLGITTLALLCLSSGAPAATLTVLHTFTGGADGANPLTGLALDSAGNLYGTTTEGGARHGGTLFKLTPQGQFTVIETLPPHSYSPPEFYGDDPSNVAVGGKRGYLYVGEAAGRQPHGIFRVNPAGGSKPVYFFDPSKEMIDPHGLSIDRFGTLTGLTGSVREGPAYDIFSIDHLGAETVLHSFGNDPAEGLVPQTGFAIDTAGNIYGAANAGGDTGNGLVFKLDPAGHETVVYTFIGGFSGSAPSGGLIGNAAGTLFGVTSKGGSKGFGLVYGIGPSGGEKVLYSFQGNADGALPHGTLAADDQDNLYGVTANFASRRASSPSTIFKLTPGGGHSVLWSFASGAGVAPLVVAKDGAIYGVNSGYGLYGVSPSYVFKLTR